jgi:signal transduction histidine kinase
VERHHGRIRLESAEGRGTTVTIDIPVRRVSKPVETPPETNGA